MVKQCVVTRKRATGVLKRPARVRALAGVVGNATPQQLAGSQKNVKSIMEGTVIGRNSTTEFSGRVLLYIAPFHVGASLCINKKKKFATCAICKPGVRAAAKPGDIIITISPALGSARKILLISCTAHARSSRTENKMVRTVSRMRETVCALSSAFFPLPPPARSRGIGKDLVERVVLTVLLVDPPKVAVPLYHSKAAPEFTEDQADRIYVTTVVDDNGKTLRDGNARMAELFTSGASVRPARVDEITNKASWLVTYNEPPCKILFRLRSRPRFHNLSGPWAITTQERIADFNGAVIVGRSFARFPSTGDNVVKVRGLGIPLPKRQFKYVTMRQGSKLRRWIDDLFQR